MSNHLKLVSTPKPTTCPLCHELRRVNPYMLEVACNVRGVEWLDVCDIASDFDNLGKKLGYPPCFFHQEGSRPDPMPWSATCELEGNSSAPPPDAV